MLLSLSLIAIISVGGAALTYLFARDEGLLWRLAAGNVIGSLLFFFPAYLLASFICLFGAVPWIAFISLAIAASPLLLLRNKKIREQYRHEKDLARGKVQGATAAKVWRFAYYAFFIVLFLVFFDKAMIVAAEGIFTGGSQNLGDLPFHLGAIFSFSEGCNFPPQNPSFAGATFTYPFTADFLTAVLVSIGSTVEDAMWVQNAAWAFSLLVILERFVLKITGSRLAGRLAPAILFLSGGMGFFWFFRDYWNGVQPLTEFLWNLPRDFTIGDDIRWGNSLTTLFITQRSLLLGMPLALIIAGFLWGRLATENPEKVTVAGERIHALFPAFLVGLVAGTLPLVHAHSLFVLFVISGVWFFFSLEKWKEWLAFGAGTALVAVPELLWILAGSASRTGEFIGWHFGFDSRGNSIIHFWLLNTGLFIPLIIAAFALLFVSSRSTESEADTTDSGRHSTRKEDSSIHDSRFTINSFAIYYFPFLVLFLISNLFKLAPWEWDNIKVLIYWFVGSIPLAVIVIVRLWEKSAILKASAALILIALILSGAIDVWRTASGQIRNQVFDSRAVDLAGWMRYYTEPDAIILNAPTYNSAAVLSGRLSVIRYIGHLSSHGIDYAEREADVKRIYAGAPDADALLRKYNVDYILVSPREREMFPVNDGFFGKFEVAHEEGAYRIYRVK